MIKNNILKTSNVIKQRLLSVKQVYENYDEKQYIKNVKRYKTSAIECETSVRKL